MFDIRLNEQQLAFQQLAREFAEQEIKPLALVLESKPKWEDGINGVSVTFPSTTDSPFNAYDAEKLH